MVMSNEDKSWHGEREGSKKSKNPFLHTPCVDGTYIVMTWYISSEYWQKTISNCNMVFIDCFIIYTVCKMKCNFLCLFPSYRWSWRHYVFGLSICLCVCAYFILYFMLACLVGGIVWLAFHRLVVYLCNNCNKPWSVFIFSLVHMYKWSCN